MYLHTWAVPIKKMYGNHLFEPLDALQRNAVFVY